MEHREKTPEAAVEAILFAMGESVELSRIASAIGKEPEETRERRQNMKDR